MKYLLIASLFVTNSVFCQTTFIGAKSGISISNIDGSILKSNGYPRQEGFYFSIFGNKKITNLFSVQAEVNYLGKGGKRNGLQEIVDDQLQQAYQLQGTTLYANYNNQVALDYLQVPLLAKLSFRLSKRINYYADFGPYVSFLITARRVTTGNSLIYLDANGKLPALLQDADAIPAISFDNKTNITNEIKTINAGATAGAGFEYNLRKGKILVETRIDNGFTNIQSNTQRNGKNYTGSFIAAAGYAFKF